MYTVSNCFCFHVEIMLHHPDEKPLMIERGMKVSPGFLTQFSVTAKYVSKFDRFAWMLINDWNVHLIVDFIRTYSFICWQLVHSFFFLFIPPLFSLFSLSSSFFDGCGGYMGMLADLLWLDDFLLF